MTNFNPVKSGGELEALIVASHETPVVVFLHDQFCPISSMAYDEMLDVGGDVALVDVTRDHDVKKAVAERSGIPHASPQVIVFRNGEVTWTASHGRIQAKAVSDALTGAAKGDAPPSD